ncbi:hypothetical protein HNO88_003676 [Novosphingobium chloroacetimidivorans]|uniref:Uncharacterized protein n=1 Tax=Novosphingobium chloroacetimidivorans TaxID=1428314 RepID=A0A7W7NX63_9SPHN|nr:hypothetical protein [Novosphingobium chloroacetimidivorans]MBB4860333.1 hypothetical protein [Novosphingobium chloroacetimidivorans]
MWVNAELTEAGLREIGCRGVVPKKVQALDAVGSIYSLLKVSRMVGKHKIKPDHFDFQTSPA